MLVPSGTLKADLAVRGAACFGSLSKELGFGYQQPGALVLAYSDADEAVLQKYIDTATVNYTRAGITPPEYRILRGDELHRFEPELNPEVKSALFAPDTGRIIPYEYGIALWENAVENGVQLELNKMVTGLSYDGAASPSRQSAGSQHLWHLKTSGKEYTSRFVINAAGHGSNEIGLLAGFKDGRITRVKGQYLILDRAADTKVDHILFQVPQEGQKKKGKGILVTKTVYGNIMIGPDARPQNDDSDTSTNLESLEEVLSGALKSVPGINPKLCIKTFAGVRPRPVDGDFIIEESNNFIHLCGIESPGLTSSPAIAADVIQRLSDMGLKMQNRSDFQPIRKPIVDRVLNLSAEEVKKRIKLEKGKAERLVCRCEQVPEGRILDALSRGIPVTTIDGLKRRTRAGQGRCQGSFCGSRVKPLIAEISKLPEEKISQRGAEPELERVTAAEIRARFSANHQKQ